MLQAKDNPESSLKLQEFKKLDGLFKCEAVLHGAELEHREPLLLE